jgi:hypothetical protein
MLYGTIYQSTGRLELALDSLARARDVAPAPRNATDWGGAIRPAKVTGILRPGA